MSNPIRYYDFHSGTASLGEAVVNGLSRKPKMIPPRFFYDARGSALFDEICRQPEYYLPAVEREMLERLADEIAGLAGRGRVLIEPGAGSAAKVRLLLPALEPAAYVPVDISCRYLRQAAEKLAAEYPRLRVHAVCADYTDSLPLPDALPQAGRLGFFPGSSLGNFEPQEAQAFLWRLSRALGREGMLLIGVDTKKSDAILDAAYNDAAGVTAAFNLNLLHRIRRELSAEVDPGGFDHQAGYNRQAGRVEMHLVSRQRQQLKFNGHSFRFEAGERVHTESSYKYAPKEFLALAARSGFRPCRHWLDARGLFAIYLLQVAGG